MPYLDYNRTADLLLAPETDFFPDPESGGKTVLLRLPENREYSRLRLPCSFPAFREGMSADEYRSMIPEEPPAQIILLIRAGDAAAGYYEGEDVRTKRFSRYMVRRGQGKAQLTYSKTRGKSRAGSRIRLQQGRLFFRDIREQLREWADGVIHAERIFLSCPVRLKNELFAGDPEIPFSADDERIRKVPFTMHRPTIEELKRIRFLLNTGEIIDADR